MAKYKKAQDEISVYQNSLDKQNSGLNPYHIDYSHFKVETYQRELLIKENDIDWFKESIKGKEDRIQNVTAAHDVYKERTIRGSENVSDRQKIIVGLKKKEKELQEELDELKEKRRVEGTAFTEVERLRADNERLLSMLGGRKRRTGSKGKPKESMATSKLNPKKTQKEWSSEDAFKLGKDILHKNNGILNEESMNLLLIDLNKIWREREDKQLDRIRKDYTMEIENLKREGMMSDGYSAVDARKEVGRLTSDLNTVYNDVKTDIVAGKKDENNPQKTDVVGDTLKATSKLQSERIKLYKENERLKAQVEKLKSNINVGGKAKEKYMEGAAWMGNTLAKETDNFANFMSRLCEDYIAKRREKEARGEVDPKVMSKLNAELVNKIENAANEFKANMHGIKANVDSQQKKLTELVKKGTKDPAKCKIAINL